MKILMLGLLVFFGIHLIPACPNWREGLVKKFGESGYKGFFSIVSAVGLALIIWGYSKSEFVSVYQPAEWSRYPTMVLMAVAFVAVAAAHMKGNLRKILRDAMSVGVALWSVAHLLSNGDLASILLFGSFLLYALLDIFTDNERVETRQFTVVPRHDMVAIIAGVVVFAVVVFLHGTLFGPALI